MRALAAVQVAFAAFMGLSISNAKSLDHGQAGAQALELAKRAIALRSVRGPGNQTLQVASLFKSALVAGGFADEDVTITPVDDTAFLIARWKGSDPKLKPIVISGHMDVVEARPSDWERDPFTPIVENGLLFGRGASDMKLDDALAVAALVELKREGYRPRREIVLEFSGDEETTMKTTQMIAGALSNSEMVLNVDGTGGQLDPEGKPQYFTWSGAEKTYGDFELTVTSPGGHSSRPYEPNAIIKNDMEFILMERKPGGYRQPTEEQRRRMLRSEFERLLVLPDGLSILAFVRQGGAVIGEGVDGRRTRFQVLLIQPDSARVVARLMGSDCSFEQRLRPVLCG